MGAGSAWEEAVCWRSVKGRCGRTDEGVVACWTAVEEEEDP